MFSEAFEIDLDNPVLKSDIELTPDKLAFLEARKDACFLCKWIVEDYKRNGTLTGYLDEGPGGRYEIFPIRGEIDHLWKELKGQPYPFKKKATPVESTIHGYNWPPPQASVEPAAPVAPEEPPVIDKNIESIPLSKPKRG